MNRLILISTVKLSLILKFSVGNYLYVVWGDLYLPLFQI